MSILGKIKGTKKAEQPSQNAKGKQPVGGAENAGDANATESKPKATAWSADRMQQLNRERDAHLLRSASGTSLHSQRSAKSTRGYNRNSGILTPDWTPKASASSSRAPSRNTSYLGLAKVVEDGDLEQEPAVPAIPARWSSPASSALSLRPNNMRSPYSYDASLHGRSALSTAETTPVDSAENSSASSKDSNEMLELRNFARPQLSRSKSDEARSPSTPALKRPERMYFSHQSTTGTSEADAAPAVKPVSVANDKPKDVAPASTKRKSRLSFMKKSDSVIAV